MAEEKFRLKLRGKACVFIDWANVYGWTKSLKQEVDPQKLYRYLNTYKEIKHVYFYFGTDKHPKSKAFLSKIKRLGYKVITKPVKYILIAEVKGEKIYKRKCDFDMEACIDAHQLLQENYESFIFFTGDGDFAPLYQLLIKKKKQVIAVYAKNHIGREIWEIKRGLFKVQIIHLGL
ncbi:MAG: NYN domain-containing protein [Patescibacteria group bacterium]